jgi:PPP family 3-phenylpropionic acid transporter
VIRFWPTIPRGDGFALRMATFYAAFFTYGGIQLPYLPAWFATRGLDDRDIGFLLAAPMLIRVVALPLIARLIDRRFDLKAALAITAAASAVGFAAMSLASSFLAIAVVFAMTSIVQAPVLPLGDSYGLRGLGARGLAYGPVRLWGSVAFILANLAGGAFLAVLGAGPMIFIVAAAMAATAAASALLRALPDRPAPAGGGLWRSGVFVAIVIGASLVQASHAVMYGFATLQWSAAGLDGTAIGALWALGVVAEVLLFAVSGRLIARFGAVAMILAGAAGAVLRWSAMAFAPPAILLPALQCLHALSFGATHVGAMQVLSQLAERRGGATAQGDFAAVQGITMAAAMGASGALVEGLGSYAYVAMAALAAVGLVTVAAGRRVFRRPDRA